MKKVGVFLARMQPVHNGHLALIESALAENDELLILIGSSDKLNERNPIPAPFRKQLLEYALYSEFHDDLGRIKIELLPDLTTESDNSHEWGFYLYANIVRAIGQHCFTMYYSDGWEIITKWFPGFLFQNSVNLHLVARNNCNNGISATKIRNAIMADNDDVLKANLPKAVYDNKETIKAFVEIWSKNN